MEHEDTVFLHCWCQISVSSLIHTTVEWLDYMFQSDMNHVWIIIFFHLLHLIVFKCMGSKVDASLKDAKLFVLLSTCSEANNRSQAHGGIAQSLRVGIHHEGGRSFLC
jgi:hypothetical protein